MNTIEETFDAMQAEWRAVCDHARADVGFWEQRFVGLAREEAQLRDSGRWIHGRADYLGVMGKHRDELMHSRMIAWLLDPCARHGLGPRVLAGLLTDVFPDSCELRGLERARTRCEVPLEEGRLDIVVESPGLYLVVENKVDAEEGDGQCAYYYEHVRRPDARFILLTPDGRKARGAEAFRPMRFTQLAAILRRALADVSSEGSGRQIVADYLSTLSMEFYDDRR
jgi:hypothetical protein